MRRVVLGLTVGMALLVVAAPARAQTYPPTTTTAPLAVATGQFTPGGTGFLTLDNINPGTWTVTVASTPFTSAPASPDAAGVATFNFAAVPADFELNAAHTATLSDGRSVGFCVNATGTVVSCSQIGATTTATTTTGGGPLPTTGASSSTDDLVRVGLASVAAGGLLVFALRRRSAGRAA